MGGGAWWAAIYGFTQSRTRLKRLSSSSRLFGDILSAHLFHLNKLVSKVPCEHLLSDFFQHLKLHIYFF